jgi:hypothetical protein
LKGIEYISCKTSNDKYFHSWDVVWNAQNILYAYTMTVWIRIWIHPLDERRKQGYQNGAMVL